MVRVFTAGFKVHVFIFIQFLLNPFHTDMKALFNVPAFKLNM